MKINKNKWKYNNLYMKTSLIITYNFDIKNQNHVYFLTFIWFDIHFVFPLHIPYVALTSVWGLNPCTDESRRAEAIRDD